jgi:hypothetical protein
MLAKLTKLGVVLSGCLLAGCATPIAGIADSSCKSFKPISMSKADTDQTKRQVIGHNKAYDAICPAQGAPQKVAANNG